MKTIKNITALLFSLLLSVLFGAFTGLPVIAVAAFVVPVLFIAWRYVPRGALGMDFVDLNDGAPVDNMGGIQSVGYVALADDVDVWPDIPGSTDSLTIVQELTGELTMKAGKYFFPFKMEVDKCSISSEDVGPKGGICQKYVLKFYRGDMALKIRGFVRATNNQELVFAVPDAQGRMNFIGSAAYPARKLPEGNATTGEGPEGESAVTMTFCSYGNGPIPILPDSISVPVAEES